MAHQPYEHLIPGCDTAVLFIHGIIGSPDHFRKFLPIAEKKYSVSNLLLEGHGKGVLDFAHTSMEAWHSQVDEKVRELLENHRRLILVAHSMGTLFAIRQAVLHPDRILFLFLLDSPVRLGLKPAMVRNGAKVFFNRIAPDDPEGQAVRDAYGIARDWRIWRYLGWIPRYLELFREIRTVRALAPGISVPCWVFQSGQDEMVSRKAKLVFSGNPHIRVRELPGSSHNYYPPEDSAVLLSEFTRLLESE